jgi:hypothetical protein
MTCSNTNEQVENALLVFFRNLETLRWRLHALVNPAAALGRVDVIDFDADGAGVDASRFSRVLALDLQFGRHAGAEKTEGIEIALQISPLAVGIENGFAFSPAGIVRLSPRDGRAAIRRL